MLFNIKTADSAEPLYAVTIKTSFGDNASVKPAQVVKESILKQIGVLFEVNVNEIVAALQTGIVDG